MKVIRQRAQCYELFNCNKAILSVCIRDMQIKVSIEIGNYLSFLVAHVLLKMSALAIR